METGRRMRDEGRKDEGKKPPKHTDLYRHEIAEGSKLKAKKRTQRRLRSSQSTNQLINLVSQVNPVSTDNPQQTQRSWEGEEMGGSGIREK